MGRRTRALASSPSSPHLRLILAAGALVVALGLGGAWLAWSPGAANSAPSRSAKRQTNGKVLILGPSVFGGTTSFEAAAAVAAGRAFDIVSAATWTSMTTAQFKAYDALIVGDPKCGGTSAYAAAAANASTWASAVDGNVIVIGTDPSYHAKTGLINPAVAFAVAASGETGAYVSLSCAYYAPALAQVSFLTGFGTFQVKGLSQEGAHIVATHPALASLTDAYLSNWSNSTHEFFSQWPPSFQVLAIATTATGTYVAPDGTPGQPYILARGVTVSSDIRLAPAEAWNLVGKLHTVTAYVRSGGSPRVDTTVRFKVVSGPNVGRTGTAATGVTGTASFQYTSSTPGTDYLEATFVDSKGRTQTSNRVTKSWYPTPSLDHYECYPLSSWNALYPKSVFLDDQFDHLRPATVGAPGELCNPVTKLASGTTYPALHPERQLVCHPSSSPATKPPEAHSVTVVDQFGSRPLVLGPPSGLCLPSGVGQPLPTPSWVPPPIPTGLAHYQCYSALGSSSAPPAYFATLTDSFWPWTTVAKTRRPIALCAPAAKKWLDHPWTAVPNARDHLLCYSIVTLASPDFGGPRRVAIVNQFETIFFPPVPRPGTYASAPDLLCVPAAKILRD